MDLPSPPPPKRVVIQPEIASVVKQRFTFRAAVVLSLLPVLVLGAIGLYRVTKGPTPDERATEAATKLAPAIVAVHATQSGPTAVAQAVAIRQGWEADTGCRVLAGSIVPGSTRQNAVGGAEEVIASARKAGRLPEGTGVGYAVVATKGVVPNVKYMAVVVAVSCVAPSPSPAFEVGS